jgi:hypothetical protein
MARDANGEVWVERGGQLPALNPHRKVRFHAVRLTANHVVVRLASSDEPERVEHGRVAKIEFDPGPTDRAGRWPTSDSTCRGVGKAATASHPRSLIDAALAAWSVVPGRRGAGAVERVR